MKAGDLVFVRGNSILSKLVRLVDKGKFSHVAIAISDKHLLETNWNMTVSIREMEYTDYEIVDLGLTEEEREMAVQAGKSMIGVRYDYFQILWYLIKQAFNLKGKNRFNSPKNLICSELIYYILLEIGLIRCMTDIDYDVTPNQLYLHAVNLKRCE